MGDAPQETGLPPGLAWLRALVMALLVTMIGCVITITWVIVTRMPDGKSVPLPENLTLPQGAKAQSFTLGPDYILIVTEDGRLLHYARDGSLRGALLLK